LPPSEALVGTSTPPPLFQFFFIFTLRRHHFKVEHSFGNESLTLKSIHQTGMQILPTSSCCDLYPEYSYGPYTRGTARQTRSRSKDFAGDLMCTSMDWSVYVGYNMICGHHDSFSTLHHRVVGLEPFADPFRRSFGASSGPAPHFCSLPGSDAAISKESVLAHSHRMGT
jgi:hypothetical protein